MTQILSEIEHGDARAADRLLPLVYDELRRLAAANLSNEPGGQTLQATALVHEAYVRLVAQGSGQFWNGRGHFFAAAAEAMRRILVENARRRKQLKNGGQWNHVLLEELAISESTPAEEVLAVHEALAVLEELDSNAATIVKLRYFTGMTLEEAAESLGISQRSAYREWAYARAWLYRTLGESQD